MEELKDILNQKSKLLKNKYAKVEKNKKASIIVIILVILGLIISTFIFSSKKTDSEVTMIDVGEAQSIVLKNGQDVVLYDAGSDDLHKTAIDDYMSYSKTDKIDTLILSHNDIQNINNAVFIIEKYDIQKIYMSDFGNGSKTYKRLLKFINEKNIEVINPHFGDNFKIGDGTIEFINPDKTYENRNDASLCIRYIDKYGLSVIATGDASDIVEKDIIKSYGINQYNTNEIKYHNYIIAGRRGSSYATSDYFLSSIQPEGVLISSGDYDTYKHPSKKLIERLEQKNIAYFKTNESSTIQLKSNETGISVSTIAIPKANEVIMTDKKAEQYAINVRKQAIAEAKYIGNRNTMHYFKNDNPKVDKITDSSITYFNSKEDAEKAGFSYSE